MINTRQLLPDGIQYLYLNHMSYASHDLTVVFTHAVLMSDNGEVETIEPSLTFTTDKASVEFYFPTYSTGIQSKMDKMTIDRLRMLFDEKSQYNSPVFLEPFGNSTVYGGISSQTVHIRTSSGTVEFSPNSHDPSLYHMINRCLSRLMEYNEAINGIDNSKYYRLDDAGNVIRCNDYGVHLDSIETIVNLTEYCPGDVDMSALVKTVAPELYAHIVNNKLSDMVQQ